MPTINIPPKVRFALYLAGVVGAVFVQYAIDRTWFGEAEMRLWTGLSAVLFMLAAAKTNTGTAADVQRLIEKHDERNRQAAALAATSEQIQASNERIKGLQDKQRRVEREIRDQRGEIGLLGICLVVLLVLVVLFAVGVLR